MSEEIVVREKSALPTLEKALQFLAQSRTVSEAKKLRTIAAAVAQHERGRDSGIDGGEIMLRADARIGELTKDLKDEKGPGRPSKSVPDGNRLSRTAKLDSEGLSRKQAAECERVRQLQDSGVLDSYITACRKARQMPTKKALLKLHRLSHEKQQAALRNVSEVNAAALVDVEVADLHDFITQNRREERVEKLAEIAQGNAPLSAPAERFPVLYADPPWRYEHAESESRAIENQYPTMSLDEICGLAVPTVVTEDAILFLWVTSPKLEEGMRVVREWGFTYRTCMVWDKEKIGMGYYARQQHELLLICTRGNPPTPPPDTRPGSVLRIARESKHSAKPVEFYELIERMYPTLPKLEMFCRKARAGWSVWGNQSRAA